MKLLKGWRVKNNNKYWLIITKDDDYVQITFSKQHGYYRVERVELEEYDEDSVTTFISIEEHQMITNILNKLHKERE
jgi:hypothetical protein